MTCTCAACGPVDATKQDDGSCVCPDCGQPCTCDETPVEEVAPVADDGTATV
jgi:hypothetical protein